MSLSEKFVDLVFLVTTCRGGSDLHRLQAMHRSPICPPGWSVRAAGPSWFLIWFQDPARLIRLRVVLVPRRWIGLSRAESLALVADQMARIESAPSQKRSSPVLRDAQHRIGRVLARHW
ncbi:MULTISPECIES: hypothetical protein [Paracoccus]|uniref:Uncharacterized protein n=1 Tax=Paracoccus litorisediminis TaxID=2006130 RepID=A0A844HF54_9RHOB|nr:MULTISPECIES: hypothetical protein [Paracoccus]MBD9525675.1 hypothetical protein [Paracoccus sp. PAR01]MTH58126.1 hypothetical protein [Paracoccus litorisediminis]